MIGLIADDITGAAELGAIGLRYGLSAEVLLQGAAVPKAPLVCVDTDSRSCAPAEAGRRAASAARKLVSAGASWIYKKVDSVLRGRIVAELEAIMAELGLSRTLLLPANPSLGRIIRQGHYWVNGKPLQETDFRHDPEYPRHSAGVLDLLGATSESVVHVCQASDRLPPSGIVVGDVASSDELKRWARQLDDSTLAAGGAEFFGALLEAKGFRTTLSAETFALSPSTNGELFVCGSTSDACRAFVAEARRVGVPVFSLPAELADGGPLVNSARDRLAQQISRELRKGRRVILSTGLPLIQEPEHARALADHLTTVAEAVMARLAGVKMFVEGGATAVELVRRVGWTRLTVIGEMGPGVVTLRPSGRLNDLLTLKPGSYAWPKAFSGGDVLGN